MLYKAARLYWYSSLANIHNLMLILTILIIYHNVYLHNDVVQAWLKAGSGCLGNRVLEVRKGNPQSQFGGDVSQWVACCLGRQR